MNQGRSLSNVIDNNIKVTWCIEKKTSKIVLTAPVSGMEGNKLISFTKI